MSQEANDRLIRSAAQLFIEHLNEEYPDGEVGVVAIVCEVSYLHEGDEVTTASWFCTDPRKFVQAGLFEMAKRKAWAGDDEEEEDDG